MTKHVLHGWGRTAPSVADVVSPTSEADVITHLATSAHVIARGLGRSYGDAAQLGGGLVLDNRSLRGISPVDADGLVTVGAGVSIDELLSVTMPLGWFVPVTPGTRQVTMGGAVAADVHGKGHHKDGSFGNHVRSMRLVTPIGARTVTPEQDADLFWATMGGMGLTGVVTEITLQMRKIETDRVLVDTDRHKNLDSVMDAMLTGDVHYNYSVAWVDCMTKGASMGRAILERGNHATAADVKELRLQGPTPPKLAVPFNAPSGILNPLSIKIFNEAWFRKAPSHEERAPKTLSTFFHPLDGVKDWNRFYGRKGFVQYQFAVPDEAGETVTTAIDRLSSSGVPSFLAVLKRFGASNPGPLSFPMPGWTLALDLPVGPSKLPGILDQLDELVLAAGGRIYFAKDARLDPAKAAAMYPRLPEFRRIQAQVDPDHILTSDLARRLELIGK